MNRRLIYGLIGIAVLVGLAGGAFLVSTYISGGSGEASGTISAPELSLNEDGAATDTNMADSGDDTMAEEGDSSDDTVAEEGDNSDDAMAEEGDGGGEAMSEESAGDRALFRITQGDSEVRFEIDEILLGEPKHVVGMTDQVAGDVIINFSSPADSELGQVVINARTITTDNEFRNRALRSRILESAEDAYEFITFTPTALDGLPAEAISVGDTVEFSLTGDLQIRDISNPVTFAASVTLVSAERVEGTAQTVVLRPDFNLVIPDVPNVAGVQEEVTLTIDFVALAVNE